MLLIEFVRLLRVNLIFHTNEKQTGKCGVRHMPYFTLSIHYLIFQIYICIHDPEKPKIWSLTFAPETPKACSLTLLKTCIFYFCTTKVHSGSYLLHSFSCNILRNSINSYKWLFKIISVLTLMGILWDRRRTLIVCWKKWDYLLDQTHSESQALLQIPTTEEKKQSRLLFIQLNILLMQAYLVWTNWNEIFAFLALSQFAFQWPVF